MNFLIKLWSLLTDIGVKKKMPLYIQKRVGIANSLSWVFILLSVSLVIFLFNDESFKIQAPIGVIILCSIIIFFNYLGFVGLSRFLLCICPPLILIGISIFAKLQKIDLSLNTGLEHYISLQYLIASLIIMPFTLFSWREKVAMFFSVFFILLITIFFDQIHTLFDVSMQDAFVKVHSYSIIEVSLFTMVFLIFFSFIFLLSMNYKYIMNSENLVETVKNKNKLANEREKYLENTLKELQYSKKQEQQQAWITKGLADFAQYLRKNDSLESLSKQIISSLVRYTEVEQGAVYIVNDEEKDVEIELLACFAYSEYFYEKKKYIPKESLVGQVYAQKRKIYLDDLPKDYLDISSGLGKTTPRYLLIVPVFNDHKVQGIVELASLQEIEDYKIEFIERMCENFASSIVNIKISLLGESLLADNYRKEDIIKDKDKQIERLNQEILKLKENTNN